MSDPSRRVVRSDIIRVLRVVEYVGEREAVERQVEHSIHGTTFLNGKVQVTAATVDPTFADAEAALMRARLAGSGPGEPKLRLEYTSAPVDK